MSRALVIDTDLALAFLQHEISQLPAAQGGVSTPGSMDLSQVRVALGVSQTHISDQELRSQVMTVAFARLRVG